MEGYKYTGPIDCNVNFDTGSLKGKTAIVTGGANGIGEAFARALIVAGARVCIGDLDTSKGKELEAELSGLKFVRCNTTKWEDQLQLFREAALFSTNGKVSYVVANAGKLPSDKIFSYSDDNQDPKEPDMSAVDINVKGTLFTSKIAFHYFVRQNGSTPNPAQEDTCLVLVGSQAAFLDCLRIPQYSATKWAARGIMHSLRRTAFYYKSRVNVVSPWFIKTDMFTDESFVQVSGAGIEFATLEDAGQCLLRVLSDSSINGHSFFVSPRKWAARGYIDLDYDDYPGDQLVQAIQEDQLKFGPVSAGLFP